MVSAYLPPISYYRALLREGAVSFSVCEDDRWQKQTLRNRCIIDSPSGPLALSIPVEHPPSGAFTRDVLISEHGAWRHRHWNALCSSYRQTPFFDYYEEDFYPFYHETRWRRLVDFNAALHAVVMELLSLSTPAEVSALAGVKRREEPYHQMFAARHGFLPDLSIADLLFNMGPEAVFYL